MQLRSRQGGLGALGWLVVLGVAAFFLLCAFRVGPIYLEQMQIKAVLDDVLAPSHTAGMSRHQLLEAIRKRFEANGLQTLSTRDIKFVESREGITVDCSYERRVPLIANIDVVVKFDQLKYTLPPR
jgi:hypothetical protein